MAIFRKEKEITSIYFGRKVVTAVYYGAKLVWEAVRSCFGNGFWINSSGWDNEESWKNNS